MNIPAAFAVAMICAVGPSVAVEKTNFGPNSPDAIKHAADQPLPTAEELAEPPAGQIQLLLVHDTVAIRDRVAALIVGAPNDATGQQSPLDPTCQAWKAKLDTFISDHTQVSLLATIPDMVAIVSRDRANASGGGFLDHLDGEICNCGPLVLRALADFITQHPGGLDASTLQKAVQFFTVAGTYSEGSFEDEAMPVDEAGVMILDPVAVVTQLKAGPWQKAKHFLGGVGLAADYFQRYTAAGDGLPLLRTKHSQNAATINAKFVELKNWVAQQAGAGGP